MHTLSEQIFQKLNQLKKPIVPSGPQFILTTCLNPSHADKHPSFSVNLEEGSGKCFSCGFSVGVDYWRTGELSEEELEELERNAKYDKLLKGYAKEQEVSPMVYLPPQAEKFTSPWRGLSVRTLNDLGIYKCQTGSYKNRVIFPMDNVYGNVEAFNTRALGDEMPKYKYSKGIKVNELAYPPVPETNYIIVVEGIMDAISMYQDNIPAIMNFGINDTIGLKKIQYLLEKGVETVYIALDDDKAGLKGTSQYLEGSLSDYFEVKLGKECPALGEFYKSDANDYSEYLEER